MAPSFAAPATDRNLWIGIGVSLALHAFLLSLHFQFPDASRAFTDKALDIILVNSKSAQKPSEAQALAQTNLDGGGNIRILHAQSATRYRILATSVLLSRGPS